MEHETYECPFKKAFEKDDGQVTVYVTKDNGTDMTIYGEALGSQRWPTGARLKIDAQPVRMTIRSFRADDESSAFGRKWRNRAT